MVSFESPFDSEGLLERPGVSGCTGEEGAVEPSATIPLADPDSKESSPEAEEVESM